MECDKKDGFGKCYCCSEVVFKEELFRYIKYKDCNFVKLEKLVNWCFLCYENFSFGEEVWKVYLMGLVGCMMNLCKIYILQKVLVLQLGKSLVVVVLGFLGLKVGSKIFILKGGLSKSFSRMYVKC